MFPIEKPAALNTIAREATGTHNNGIFLNTVIDENHLEKQVEKGWAKISEFFNDFGVYSSTAFGIYVFFRLIKFPLDTIINGIALHAIYGWSICLLVSIWDSVVNWLLHFRRGPLKNPTETREQSDPKQTVAIPMGEVQTVEPRASRVW